MGLNQQPEPQAAMGEARRLFTTTFNHGLALESRTAHLTGDGGMLTTRSRNTPRAGHRLDQPEFRSWAPRPCATLCLVFGQDAVAWCWDFPTGANTFSPEQATNREIWDQSAQA
jgi:hypothetical protein